MSPQGIVSTPNPTQPIYHINLYGHWYKQHGHQNVQQQGYH